MQENAFNQIYKSKIFISWIESVILIVSDIGYGGPNGWDQSINVVVIHHEAPVMDWAFVSSPDLHVEATTVNMTVLGDRAFMKVTKVKWGRKGGPLIQKDWWL